MFHGNLSNTKILKLIQKGVKIGDTVYSTTWKETLQFNGTVFQSLCNCNYLGKYPNCSKCPGVIESIGSFSTLAL